MACPLLHCTPGRILHLPVENGSNSAPPLEKLSRRAVKAVKTVAEKELYKYLLYEFNGEEFWEELEVGEKM